MGFASEIRHSLGTTSRSVAVRDFNNDNILDLVVTLAGNSSMAVLLGYGNGSFYSYMVHKTASFPQSVVIADLNNDTHVDLVVLNRNSNNVGILLGHSNGSFAQQVTYPVDRIPFAMRVADLNNDARLDIVTTNVAYHTISVLLGHGDGSFTNATTIFVGQIPLALSVADFNKDGYADLIVPSGGSNHVNVFLGYGNGSFDTPIKYVTGSAPDAVDIHDFNSDGYPDVIVANSGEATVIVMFGCSNSIFLKRTTLTAGESARPSSFAVADANNDKKIDIVVVSASTNHFGVFLGHGDLSFAQQIIYPIGTNSSRFAIATGDFNSDTRLDIAIASYDTDSVVVFLGSQNGSFINRMMHSTGASSSPSSIAVGRFDSDNNVDIIVTNYNRNEFGVLLGHGDGTFDDIVSFSTSYGSQPWSIAVADFNKDGKADVAVMNNGTDSVSIYLETC